ncbi:MAG: phage tail tube protein [Pseudomonadota bacterium]|nr:phage tail tube protein [Pseudomonadota bacterium]
MAKARAYGADAQLLATFESTYGTAPDGSGGGVYKKLSFKSSTLGGEKPLGYDPILGQGRDAQDPYYDALTVNGDIVVPVDLRAIGFWLKGLLGSADTTDNLDGTYTHVFTSGGDLPSLAIETGHTALTTPVFDMRTGAKLGGLQIDMQRTGPVNMTINGVVAQGEASASSSEDSTPGTYALSRFSQGSGSIELDSSQLAAVTGGSLTFSNNLEPVETIRDDGKIDGVDETEATAEGSITVRYSTDSTIRDTVDAETPVAMQYGWSIPGSEGYALTFDFPRVFLPKVKQPVDGPGGVQAEYNWRAAYDASSGHMMQVTLVNDVASY